MFIVNEDNSMYITRGDVAFFSVSTETDEGEMFKFQPGDVVRFKVTEKKACDKVVLSKDVGIEAETEEVLIYLEEKDTKIGSVISKPKEYWYEVELNPYTDPQTIIGYDDENGPKIFKLFPEGGNAVDEDPITPEDIPVVDEELSLTSTRPVQNQAIARAIIKARDDVAAEFTSVRGEFEALDKQVTETIDEQNSVMEDYTVRMDEKIASLSAEDITDEFATMLNGTVFDSHSRVYKLSNLIHAHLVLKIKLTEMGYLFKVNEKYYSADLNLRELVGLMRLGGELKGVGFFTFANGTGELLMATPNPENYTDTTAHIDFTYICP